MGSDACRSHRDPARRRLLPDGRALTNAIDIDAPPSAVWPWIAQLGRGRGGFCTYTWVENLLGADIHNLDRIGPDLQHLGEGDRIWLTPPRYLGQPGQFWTVRSVAPGRSVVLDQRPPHNPTTGTWTLALEPANGRSRLLNRHRSDKSDGLILRWAAIMTLGNLVMERGMLRGIKQRAEAMAESVQSSPVRPPSS
jgi:hypothetical protein